MSNQLFPVATQKITDKSGDSSILLLANYTGPGRKNFDKWIEIGEQKRYRLKFSKLNSKSVKSINCKQLVLIPLSEFTQIIIKF